METLSTWNLESLERGSLIDKTEIQTTLNSSRMYGEDFRG